MSDDTKPRPNGATVFVPWPWKIPGKIGATYYWNPGSPDAPHFTITRQYGFPSAGIHAVFLRKGMTSQDTIGNGIRGNISTFVPSISVDGTLPRGEYEPWKSRVTAIEAGGQISPEISPAVTSTYTPQQFLHLLMSPAGGPQDELPPPPQSPQTGQGTVSPPPTEPPVRYLSKRYLNPLGEPMTGWASSVSADGPQYVAPAPAQTAPEAQSGPGGLYGLLFGPGSDWR